jgi:hypothetical protein
MAFVVSSLADYTRQNAESLFMASHFDAKTQTLIMKEGNVMTKVKSAETINLIATDAFFQSDTTCGFNASGTTTFTQRTVTVGKMKVQQQFCKKELEAKYLQEALKAGSSDESFAFEQPITEEIAQTIAEQLEVAIWTADTAGSAGSNGSLNKFDGILKLLNAASGTVVQANASGYLGIAAVTGNITTTNVRNIVDAMWVALPAKIQGKSDIRIFSGFDTYNTYLQAYRDQNLFSFAPTQAGEKASAIELLIPGTNYRLTPVHGLDGTKRLVAIRMSNLFLGVDLEFEEDSFKIWYSPDDMVNKLHVAFKTGINFAFPGEIVNFII